MPYSIIFAIYLLFVAILFSVPARPLADADTGWHLSAGQEIIDKGSVPQHNNFSFTADDYSWTNLSWGWDIIFGQIDRLGGLYLVAAVTIILGGMMIGFLTWFCLNRGAGMIGTLIALSFGLFGFIPALLVRPHQVTNIFTLCFTVVLYFFAKNPQHLKKMFLLPVLMLLWVNMHGGFFTGFTIIAAYFAQFMFAGQIRQVKQLAFFTFLSVIAVFFNPLGVHVFEAAYRTLGGPMKAYISEWRSPSNGSDFIYIVFFVLVFVPSFKIYSLAEKLLCLFWLLETFLAIRNLSIFMLVSTPVLANGIVHLGGKYEVYREREHDYATQFSSPFMNRLLPLSALCLSLAFLTPQWSALAGFNPESKNFPKSEIDYIIKTRPQAVLFNHYDYGGYVIYESKGSLKTFIDGRAETAFPPEVIKDYLAFDIAASGWEKMLDKYHADTALMPRELGVQLDYFKEHWRIAYQGNSAIVFVRDGKQ